MRPPVELHRPTILNLAAITCYCLATMFHIIAYATDNWSSLTLDGVKWRVGLWHGCWQNGSDWQCSTEVFEKDAFRTGSDWHIGSRVMMTMALILLFFLEFAIIGYACIKNLERHKSRLVGIIIGLSISAGGFILVTIILVGGEAPKVPGSEIGWSFGMCVLSLLCLIICLVAVAYDCIKHNRKSKEVVESTASVTSDTSLDYESRMAYTNTIIDLNLEEDAF